MIIIEAKKWFQKSSGNTYHSVSISKNGQFIGYKPFTYGYDSAYLQTAAKMLDMDYMELVKDIRDNAKNYHITVNDVSRKKDL